jgi:hypothetical protein
VLFKELNPNVTPTQTGQGPCDLPKYYTSLAILIVCLGEREPDDMQHAIVDFLEAQGNPRMKFDFKPVR